MTTCYKAAVQLSYHEEVMTAVDSPGKVVTTVVWNKPDSQYFVPLWIIILAILAGLLLLALLIYVLYKVRVSPATSPSYNAPISI